MSSQNEKNELKSFIDDFSIINEEDVKEGENLTLKKSKILNEKAEKQFVELLKIMDKDQDFFVKLNILIKIMKYIV